MKDVLIVFTCGFLMGGIISSLIWAVYSVNYNNKPIDKFNDLPNEINGLPIFRDDPCKGCDDSCNKC
jgi:hypothetical protein